MNQGVQGLASPHGHEERVQYEFSGHGGLGGPADNAAGVQVHHDGQIEPAFPRAHIRDVGDPGGVRSLDGQSSLQGIGRQERCVPFGVPVRICRGRQAEQGASLSLTKNWRADHLLCI